MLRPRKQPDTPLAQRKRRLAEQERQLAERMANLHHKLSGSDGEPAAPVNLPVWRLEEDSHPPRATESISQRKRHLGRQRQRDMIIFFIMMGALIIVVIMVLALAQAHGQNG